MEESLLPSILEAKIKRVTFSLATRQEICKASISECPISHASQLSNPFLGLPLEVGKCESCGTGEPGQCEGHFGYIELPTPIYHPNHVNALKKLLSLLCLKCLKLKNRKARTVGIMDRMLSACCEETSQISINEVQTTDGAAYLELKIPSKSQPRGGIWSFLEKYGFRYGNAYSRPLLPSEVMAMLRKLPQDTRKKLSAKEFFPQDGYIIQHLPVPPNCLSVPDITDGLSTMSTDHSVSLMKKVLRQVEIIKNSRSGKPNFESQEIEANDLQAAVKQYLEFRGTGKATRDVDTRFGVHKDENVSSTKAWLEKMKTLFIRKGSGFSSRSVITGDPFKGVSEIGLPYEIAQKITFEERVNEHNVQFLQKLVDEKLCLTYRDGQSTYSLKEGSTGHTFLRPGQVVHRRIMDGDVVFINRPPTTHKHSLQALSVYVHDDHTVKINPLICGPLSADFDGDCIHLFYPQSLEAKAEVIELFAVEKQLLSSHTGNFNLQLTSDSLLSLKSIFKKNTLNRAKAHQLAMFVPVELLKPEIMKNKNGPLWTAAQILQATLPPSFDCSGERHTITKSEILKMDSEWDAVTSIATDIVTSLFFLKGPKAVLKFFDSLQPLLMENLYSEGFSVSLRDFCIPEDLSANIQAYVKKSSSSDFYLHDVKVPLASFIKASALGHLIDSKSESALNKVVQQIGFMGTQISDKGKFYSSELVKGMESLFVQKYPVTHEFPVEEFGLVGAPLFRGLDPYQEMVHSISSREVIVRSSRGLTEPGTLFKNLMAILRDVVICHDGTVRNICSNVILQFEYGVHNLNVQSEFCAGEPVGVLAATAMSNPAYKAVLDSSPSSNNSWEMMKEILLCGANFKNDVSDRRIILYLKNCDCGGKYCQENAAIIVRNHLKKVSLKDAATDFLIEYRSPQMHENFEISEGLVGHIHLDKAELTKSNITMRDILEKCQDTIMLHQKKKKVGNLFKRIDLSYSDCCSFPQSGKSESKNSPCIQFLWQGTTDDLVDKASQFLADTVCPALLQTVIKGDPRVSTANKIWISPDTANWISIPSKNAKGELALEVTLEKEAVRKSGDAWRTVMDSCLPIIHLIDTERSIPYSIKQVQELLGISCAFDQAVQRLSTSVTMVTKGVLKEHLLLLGNSMTCSGTLIGFNTGGIKALSKSLNVQVPFMNATLFTPRKCFETAAEKCQADNLSSVVAACAWGKHVSVGTGSPFEILWDTRKAELNPEKEIDVYNFLHLVSGSSGLGDMGTSCLGEDNGLDLEDEFGLDMSPERESGQEKPIFDDGDEFTFKSSENDGFAMDASWGKKADSVGNDWGKEIDNSSWGKKVVSTEGNDDWSKATQNSSNWGKKADTQGNEWAAKEPAQNSSWGSKKVPNEGNDGASNWGKKADTQGNEWVAKELAQNSSWGSKKVPNEGNDAASNWGKKADTQGNEWAAKEPVQNSSWGSKKVPTEGNDGASSWGKKADTQGNEWAAKEPAQNSSWGCKKVPTEGNAGASSWGKKVDTQGNEWAAKEPGQNSSWGSKKVPTERNDGASSWGKKVDTEGNDWPKDTEKSSWGKNKETEKSSWGASPTKSTSQRQDFQSKDSPSLATWGKDAQSGSTWGKKSEENSWGAKDKSSISWGKDVQSKDSLSPATWGQDSQSGGKKTEPEESRWGAKEKSSNSSWGQGSKDKQPNSWGQKEESEGQGWNAKGSSWGAAKSGGLTFQTEQDQTDTSTGGDKSSWEAKTPNTSSAWGASGGWGKVSSSSSNTSSEKKDSWSSPKTNDLTGWGAKKFDNDDSSQPSQGWGRGRGGGRDRGRGRGRGGRGRESFRDRGDGDWKNTRSDDPNAPAILTMTRQRLDLFTSELQDVLTETEAIMKNVRRIMSLKKYNDGDPLPEEDQKYIIENVFNYHPDKAVKMGAGLDHIMVNKHKEFQESRCFYAVSVNGNKEDFSYFKCLENFVKEKYPDKAEEFLPMYFKKRQQPRAGWNNEQGPGRDGGAGTPRWNRDRTPTQDDAGTPRWKSGGTPGWNGGTTPTRDNAGTPGWNGGTPARDNDATPGGTTGWNSGTTPAGDNDAGKSGWN